MCFYDQYRYECGDWKWGNFKEHCNKEYRMGETCGMKFVNNTYALREKCKVCEKIDTKKRRRAAEVDKINRWTREGGKLKASIEKSWSEVRKLDSEIEDLEKKRSMWIHQRQASGSSYSYGTSYANGHSYGGVYANTAYTTYSTQ
jgi:hypothetical protein